MLLTDKKNLILCVDDRGGMSFNKRRVSRDCIVTEKIMDIAGERLYIFPCSIDLFPTAKTYTSDGLLQTGDYLFIENLKPDEYIMAAECIYLFRWGRVYPSDLKAPLDMFSAMHCVSKEEFVGNSHEKITMEVLIHG